MATTRKPWTRHKIMDSALKQLAAAVNREDGSLYPGVGYGAPSSRQSLIARGLVDQIERRPSCGYKGTYDVAINDVGRKALAEARREGW